MPSQPRRTSGPKSSRDASKTQLACFTCRKRKVKCSGTSPCLYCSKRGLQCTTPLDGQKRVYSASRIAELESRLAQYENVANSSPNGRNVVPVASPAVASSPGEYAWNPEAQSSLNHNPSRPVASPHFASRDAGIGVPMAASTPGSTIQADASLSSSYNFGSRVRDMLDNARPQQQNRPPPPTGPSMLSAQTRRPVPERLRPNTDPQDFTDPLPALPSEEEARRLLETVVLYIGYLQHHFDPRDFTDRMGLFFSNPENPCHYQTPWYLEMLLVLAIGKLFAGDFSGIREQDTVPGAELFEFVQKNLPTISDLYSHGILGIELLALVAVYLQNVYRMEEAYIYISTALRLAVVHGYNKNSVGRSMSQSEKVHMGRLWWTIYMQERRLAAATGNPSGIADDSVEIGPPVDSFGFSPVSPLLTNVKIGKVMGQIIDVIYRRANQAEESFIRDVQDIVKSLYEISQELPPFETANSPSSEHLNFSARTSASLRLFLYPAILLTIRPLMLHVAQLILSGNLPKDLDLNASSLGRLSRTCSEAARRLLRVLMTLKERQMIVIFGFFDLDAIFSAAFIMILTTIFDSACSEDQKINPTPGLPQALEILQYLADRGNTVALQRLEEVQKIWSHLSAYLRARDPVASDSVSDSQSRNTAAPSHLAGAPTRNNDSVAGNQRSRQGREKSQRQMQQPPSLRQESLRDGQAVEELPSPVVADLWNDLSYLCIPDPSAYHDNTLTELPMDYYGYCLSLQNDPDWLLTGQDVGDFAELRRHVLGSH